jgi:hypothetical protein
VTVRDPSQASATQSFILTVQAASVPVITAQPQNQTVSVGQSATFTVAATGTPTPTYQWQRNGIAISGATAATYVSPVTQAADNGAAFRCVISNSAGSATSNTATLTVTGATAYDIGGPAPTGSSTVSGGTITVKGGGADIWGTSDAFQYDAQALIGDGQITARVVSQTASDPWAKAGVMIRENLSDGSRQAMTVVTPDNGIAFQRRLSANGASSHTAGAKATAPYWVRIARVGNLFTASQSKDGVTWNNVGSATIAMGSSAFIGLAVTSHHNGALSTAVFDSISIVATPTGGG